MVVGFGLKDSIMNIASLQYDNIQLYDAMAALNTDETDKLDDPDKTLNEIMENESGIGNVCKGQHEVDGYFIWFKCANCLHCCM